MILPNQQKQWIQNNESEIFSNLNSLYDTYNMDFESNKGAIRVFPRIVLNTNGLDGCPWGFRFFDTRIWAGAGTLIYSNSGVPQGNFSADASTDFQSDYSSDESDMETFNGTLCTTTTDALYSKVSNGSGTGAWTARDALSTGGQHILAYFKKVNRLYYTNLSASIISISTAWATADPGVDYAITLSVDTSSYTITSFKFSSDRAWIGILDKTKEGATGKIVTWDGISSQIMQEYKLNSQGCLCLIIDPRTDAPFVIDVYGSLLQYNNAGFEEVGRLPVSSKHLQAMNDVDNERFIHPNGMVITKEGNIRVMVNNINVDGTYNENFKAGVYEFRPIGNGKYSCHHLGSPSSSGATITDYGQTRLSRVGALASMDVYSNSANRNGTFLCGATYFTNASSTSSAIFYDDSNDTLQKAGYLVTAKIFSPNITEFWNKLIPRLKRLRDSSDLIVGKYCTSDFDHLDINITTWSSSNSVRTDTDISDFAVGDEIEFTQGEGAGRSFHIETITDLGGSVTEIHLDDAFTGLSGASGKARLQKWKKMGEFSSQEENFTEFDLTEESNSVWVKFKIFMIFKGKDEIYDFNLINQVDKLIQ